MVVTGDWMTSVRVPVASMIVPPFAAAVGLLSPGDMGTHHDRGIRQPQAERRGERTVLVARDRPGYSCVARQTCVPRNPQGEFRALSPREMHEYSAWINRHGMAAFLLG
jgi:hypothetical protein